MSAEFCPVTRYLVRSFLSASPTADEIDEVRMLIVTIGVCQDGCLEIDAFASRVTRQIVTDGQTLIAARKISAEPADIAEARAIRNARSGENLLVLAKVLDAMLIA